MTLYEQRNIAICCELEKRSIKKVLDMGCGDGKLVYYLSKKDVFKKVCGMDCSSGRIKKAQTRCNGVHNASFLLQSFFEYNISFTEYDAIILSEVIEHFTESDLKLLFDLIFSNYNPDLVIITTPNRSYNKNYAVLCNGFRHSSHIFELTEEDVVLFSRFLRQRYTNYNYIVGFCDTDHASHIIICEREF